MDSWELTAGQARTITDDTPIRRLTEVKQDIMRHIKRDAEKGRDATIIYMKDYPQLKCLEDWSYLYNWLLSLGYQISDNSLDGEFFVTW